MRFAILSLLMLALVWPGACGKPKKPKPVQCRNPKGKQGASLQLGCSRSVCERKGEKGTWSQCSKPATEIEVKKNGEKLDGNHELALDILKLLGNCCPKTTTWEPAVTTYIEVVDGGWSIWGNWAPCDSSTGTKKRARQCDNPTPSNGGAPCTGSSQESEKCSVNGGWSIWGNWAACDSITGTKKRSRQCNNPTALNGGSACVGLSQETAKCPVNGGWSIWGNWAACDSNTGTKKRSRQCNNPTALNGGTACAGISQETARCPVNGGWSIWGNWATCDSNTGTKKRSRQCNNPTALNGGTACAGISQETAKCPVNGGWSAWGRWASCDSSKGTKKRSRQCNSPSPLNGGTACVGISQETAKCPVNGGWSIWGSWASCDSSTGKKKRSRQCNEPSPLNGGATCAGISQESVNCPVTCPSDWKLFESHCYRLFENKFVWSKAEDHCQQEKGHLASVHSYGENYFLYQMLTSSDHDAWLGINDIKTEGNFVWSDGSAVDFKYWYTGEPNNHGGDQDCGQMYRAYNGRPTAYNGRWDDDDCDHSRAFICKKKGLVEVFSKVSLTRIQKNQQLSTLEFLGKQWIVSFDFYFYSFSSDYQNILHLTIGGDSSKYGDRTPSLYLTDNGFHISSAISGEANNYKDIAPPRSARRWMQFEISQIWKNKKYMFEVKVEDKSYWVVENNAPALFKSVKLFAADNWYDPASGWIKNLKVHTITCCEVLTVEGRIFATGKYTRQNSDYNKKPWYKDVSGKWCIFHGGENIYGGHWKVDYCTFVEQKKDWSRGWGWSDIESACPGDIGANWRYYSHSGGSDSGPIDLGIVISCN